jgi:hypothetical protein
MACVVRYALKLPADCLHHQPARGPRHVRPLIASIISLPEDRATYAL